MENRAENVSEQYSGEIMVKGDKFKLALGDQEVYNNGETVWTYFKDVNEVNIDNFVAEDGEMTPVTIYTGYTTGYKYRFVESKKSGATTLNIVELQPEAGSKQFDELIKIRLEVDAADNTVSFMEIFDKTGSVYSYKMSGFSVQSGLSDATFNFDVAKHPGVEVVDLR
jgi:outer membrane lipoprotein-sorting protein